MKLKVVVEVIGSVLKYIGVVLLAPVVFALCYKEYGAVLPFVVTALISILLGFLLNCKKTDEKKFNEMNKTEALAVVFFSWVMFGLICTIPFLLFGFSPINALFESFSGITTTGASVLTDYSIYPKVFFVYRAMIQWMGGMGIIILFIAILPKFAVAGRQMLFAELPNVLEEKIAPRIKQTAIALWGIYIGLTILEILFLKFLGRMNFHDAICCSFSTLAAGGMANGPDNVLTHGNAFVMPIIAVFMFLAGTNFVLQYKVFVQRRFSAIFKNEEFLTYFGILTVASLLIAVVLFSQNHIPFLKALGDAIFQSVSMVTTTAFFTEGAQNWHYDAKVLLVALMFFGACAGSTSGGIKIARWIFIFKYLKKEISKIIHPKGVFPIRIEGAVVSEDVCSQLVAFIFFFFVIFGLSTFFVGMIEQDTVAAMTGSISTLTNTGVIFGEAAGFGSDFSTLHPITKLIFIFNMLVGRLELIPFLALLHPDVWERR